MTLLLLIFALLLFGLAGGMWWLAGPRPSVPARLTMSAVLGVACTPIFIAGHAVGILPLPVALLSGSAVYHPISLGLWAACSALAYGLLHAWASRPITRSRAPGGRFVIRTHPWRPHSGPVVEPPEIFDAQSLQTLLRLRNPNWSLVGASWHDRRHAALRLRQYPCDPERPALQLQLDCEQRTATIGAGPPISFDTVEQALAQAWAQTQPFYRP